jgi:choline dehydrogenase-like flavoprotein
VVLLKTVERSDERILVSDIFEIERGRKDRPDLGTLHEPGRHIPVYRNCDVLVVGGGPSGTAAAVAAARPGAEVILLERYNHLGGLSTGGLVIWIDRMTDWGGQQVIRGFAEEILDRLPADAVAGPAPEEWGSRDAARAAHWSQRTAAYHGVVTWSRSGSSLPRRRSCWKKGSAWCSTPGRPRRSWSRAGCAAPSSRAKRGGRRCAQRWW